MITLVEIDGFKTFQDFKLELSPFQVIVGPNGSGKSNLFDALHLLSRLKEFHHTVSARIAQVAKPHPQVKPDFGISKEEEVYTVNQIKQYLNSDALQDAYSNLS